MLFQSGVDCLSLSILMLPSICFICVILFSMLTLSVLHEDGWVDMCSNRFMINIWVENLLL